MHVTDDSINIRHVIYGSGYYQSCTHHACRGTPEEEEVEAGGGSRSCEEEGVDTKANDSLQDREKEFLKMLIE